MSVVALEKLFKLYHVVKIMTLKNGKFEFFAHTVQILKKRDAAVSF